MKNKFAIIGDGGWGTTLAILLSRKGFDLTLWSVSKEYAAHLDRKRINNKFLPNILIPRNVRITSDLKEAIEYKDLIIFAVPSQFAREALRKIKRINLLNSSAILVSVTKGIEVGTLKRISQIVHEELGNIKFAVLSGPTIAQEVVKGIPTAAVIASNDNGLRKYLQGFFMTERFIVYTNDDIVGV
jgi:glycerol-3-phosphate dehydrogenase (NAD(P)+)